MRCMKMVRYGQKGYLIFLYFKCGKQRKLTNESKNVKKKEKVVFNGYKCSRYSTHELFHVPQSIIFSSMASCVEDFELSEVLQIL